MRACKAHKTGEQQQDAHERDQAADPDAQRRMAAQHPQTEQQDGEGEEKKRRGTSTESCLDLASGSG